jgi:hypothetical protein
LDSPSKDAHRIFPLDTETLPKEGDYGNQRNTDGRGDPLVLMTLNCARHSDHNGLINPVPTNIEVQVRILKLLDDQSLDVAVHLETLAGGVDQVATGEKVTVS